MLFSGSFESNGKPIGPMPASVECSSCSIGSRHFDPHRVQCSLDAPATDPLALTLPSHVPEGSNTGNWQGTRATRQVVPALLPRVGLGTRGGSHVHHHRLLSLAIVDLFGLHVWQIVPQFLQKQWDLIGKPARTVVFYLQPAGA